MSVAENLIGSIVRVSLREAGHTAKWRGVVRAVGIRDQSSRTMGGFQLLVEITEVLGKDGPGYQVGELATFELNEERYVIVVEPKV